MSVDRNVGTARATGEGRQNTFWRLTRHTCRRPLASGSPQASTSVGCLCASAARFRRGGVARGASGVAGTAGHRSWWRLNASGHAQGARSGRASRCSGQGGGPLPAGGARQEPSIADHRPERAPPRHVRKVDAQPCPGAWWPPRLGEAPPPAWPATGLERIPGRTAPRTGDAAPVALDRSACTLAQPGRLAHPQSGESHAVGQATGSAERNPAAAPRPTGRETAAACPGGRQLAPDQRRRTYPPRRAGGHSLDSLGAPVTGGLPPCWVNRGHDAAAPPPEVDRGSPRAVAHAAVVLL